MTIQQALGKLGETSARSLLHILSELNAGLIDLDTAQELMSTVLEVAGIQGIGLGNNAYAAHALRGTGTAPPVTDTSLQIAAAPTRERVGKALDTVFSGDPEDRETRLERLGYADPVNAALQSFGKAMREDPRVTGWTRQLTPDACELCHWLAQEGRTFPPEREMTTHPGDTCTQLPSYD